MKEFMPSGKRGCQGCLDSWYGGLCTRVGIHRRSPQGSEIGADRGREKHSRKREQIMQRLRVERVVSSRTGKILLS